MKVLLTTLNAKWSHSSLALRYIRAAIDDLDIAYSLEEYTINAHLDDLLRHIHRGQFDLILFGVYIWNRSETLQLARHLKKIRPELTIVFGGPEVSYQSASFMDQTPWLDAVIVGEGEWTTRAYLQARLSGEPLNKVSGLVYRENGQVVVNQPRPLIQQLDDIPFPYIEDEMLALQGRLVYYESSRGCPFDCQYCLSSTIKGVRFFGMERICKDLTFFAAHRVPTVKFVDRTFNASPKHAMDIFKHIESIDNGETKWHFEITADRLTDDMLSYLEQVRPGLFQFEIGVQSTHEPTLKEIRRQVDFERLSDRVRRLKTNGNIHLHLDLIAGLPYETYERFLQSFDDVHNLEPDMLQLGFLKVLRGSGLREREAKYGFVYSDVQPYEVLATNDITCDDLMRLKDIEVLLGKYGNSGRFSTTLQYFMKGIGLRPSKFYEAFSDWWREKELDQGSVGQVALYEVLFDFSVGRQLGDPEIVRELLRFDYYASTVKRTSRFLSVSYGEDFRAELVERLHAIDAEIKWFGHLGRMPLKNILKRVRGEVFSFDPQAFQLSGYQVLEKRRTILLFDYTSGSVHRPACRIYTVL